MGFVEIVEIIFKKWKNLKVEIWFYNAPLKISWTHCDMVNSVWHYQLPTNIFSVWAWILQEVRETIFRVQYTQCTALTFLRFFATTHYRRFHKDSSHGLWTSNEAFFSLKSRTFGMGQINFGVSTLFRLFSAKLSAPILV